MFLGCAILLATILFLVDRNKKWRQFWWVAGSLCIAAVLIVAGFFGWVKWQERKAEKAEAATIDFSKYAKCQGQYTAADAQQEAPATIPAGAKVIRDDEKPAKKHKPFGNATVQADAAIVWNGMSEITVLSHPARVFVTGENGSKYQVRLADGRTGEMEMTEIRKDSLLHESKVSQ